MTEILTENPTAFFAEIYAHLGLLNNNNNNNNNNMYLCFLNFLEDYYPNLYEKNILEIACVNYPVLLEMLDYLKNVLRIGLI